MIQWLLDGAVSALALATLLALCSQPSHGALEITAENTLVPHLARAYKHDKYVLTPQAKRMRSKFELCNITEAAAKHSSDKRHIILTGGDSNYKDLLLNWALSMEMLGIHEYIVLCYDRALFNLIGHWHSDNRGGGHAVYVGFNAKEKWFKWAAKLFAMSHLLEEGYVVTWIDADGVLLRGDLIETWIMSQNGTMDIVGQMGQAPLPLSDIKGPTICTGLFTLYPTERTRAALWRTLFAFGKLNEREFNKLNGDQGLLNYVLDYRTKVLPLLTVDGRSVKYGLQGLTAHPTINAQRSLSLTASPYFSAFFASTISKSSSTSRENESSSPATRFRTALAPSNGSHHSHASFIATTVSSTVGNRVDTGGFAESSFAIPFDTADSHRSSSKEKQPSWFSDENTKISLDSAKADSGIVSVLSPARLPEPVESGGVAVYPSDGEWATARASPFGAAGAASTGMGVGGGEEEAFSYREAVSSPSFVTEPPSSPITLEQSFSWRTTDPAPNSGPGAGTVTEKPTTAAAIEFFDVSVSQRRDPLAAREAGNPETVDDSDANFGRPRERQLKKRQREGERRDRKQRTRNKGERRRLDFQSAKILPTERARNPSAASSQTRRTGEDTEREVVQQGGRVKVEGGGVRVGVGVGNMMGSAVKRVGTNDVRSMGGGVGASRRRRRRGGGGGAKEIHYLDLMLYSHRMFNTEHKTLQKVNEMGEDVLRLGVFPYGFFPRGDKEDPFESHWDEVRKFGYDKPFYWHLAPFRTCPDAPSNKLGSLRARRLYFPDEEASLITTHEQYKDFLHRNIMLYNYCSREEGAMEGLGKCSDPQKVEEIKADIRKQVEETKAKDKNSYPDVDRKNNILERYYWKAVSMHAHAPSVAVLHPLINDARSRVPGCAGIEHTNLTVSMLGRDL